MTNTFAERTNVEPDSDGTFHIRGCEVCGNAALMDVLDLGIHPLCDDLVPVGDDRIPIEYPISIAFCPTCKTAHQNFQVPKRTLFPESYHYRAHHTADVLNGMRQLVAACQGQLGDLKGWRVLDIGCNDGSLLSIFAGKGATTYGIEPTGAVTDARAAGHSVDQDFLTPELAERFVRQHGQPDIITFTNVFAHIEDLSSVIRAVRTLMSPSTLLVIENHYLGAVLERHQFDTFYHEHPRTYSLTSFMFIAETLGAKIVLCEFPARYGGNIRVMMQAAGSERVRGNAPDLGQHLAREGTFEQELIELARRIPLWQEMKRAELNKVFVESGPLSGKAFPGRAAILVRLLGLDVDTVSAVYEKPGSMKIGHYIPGTRIPIRSDDEFAVGAETNVTVLNLAWHISSEIHDYMKQRGFNGTIIDILQQQEIDRLSEPLKLERTF